MSVIVPSPNLLMRWNAIACAVVIFIWSTPEEDRPIFSAVLGGWLAISLMLHWITGRYAGVTLRNMRLVAAAALFGGAVGMLTSVCAVLLMVFKDARHAHLYPDYPPALLGAMLARLPAWTLAGALACVGAVLIRVAIDQRGAETASLENRPML